MRGASVCLKKNAHPTVDDSKMSVPKKLLLARPEEKKRIPTRGACKEIANRKHFSFGTCCEEVGSDTVIILLFPKLA